MIRYIPTLIIIVLIVCASASNTKNLDSRNNQTKRTDKILWSANNKLTWGDFKGKAKEDRGTVIAITQCQVKIVNRYWYKNIPRYEIGTYFLKLDSWTTTVDDLSTLNHEQLHFDIYELYARKIRKEFERLNSEKVTDFKEYNTIYSKLVNEAIKANQEYDNEVYFNEVKQQAWIDKVGEELEALKDYEYHPEE